MTATMNTGAETIRVDGKYVPLLLQLKTTGAVGVDSATSAAIDALEAADLVRSGELHPMADAMLEIVSEPALVVSIERMRLGAVAASTIWATQAGATVGTRVDGALYELKLASSALLPFYLYQLIHLRPLPGGPRFEVTLSAEAMLTAEAHVMASDARGAQAGIEAAGNSAADAAAVVATLRARVASWRIHSLWSAEGGTRSAEAHGMDCGGRGHVLVTVGTGAPSLTLRSAQFTEVVAGLRRLLPR